MDCPAVSVFLPTFFIKGGEKIAFLRGISVAVIPLREKMGNYDTNLLWKSLKGLYHYERKWGTTTAKQNSATSFVLYHYERKWGTTTMSLPQIFRDDFTAYYIRIYRFRQSPNGEKRF